MKDLFKKSFAILLAAVIFFGVMPFGMPDSANAAVEADNYRVITEFYSYDSVSGTWVPTKSADAGEQVKLRVSAETGFNSGTASLLFAFDKSVLSANSLSDSSSERLTVNTNSSFVNNEIQFVNGAIGTGAAKDQFSNGLLTKEQLEKYSFVVCSVYVKGCAVYDASDWIFEIDMTVLKGTKDKEMECFIIPETVSSLNNRKGFVKFPKAPDGSESSSALSGPWLWYDGTPELSSQKITVTDNIEGEEYREGYDYAKDSFGFSGITDTVSQDIYCDVFGDAKGKVLHEAFENGDAPTDLNYGMTLTTGALLAGNPSVSSFIGPDGQSENISEINKGTSCYDLNGVSAETLIKYGYVTQFSSETNIVNGDCADIYDLVYDYVYNGGAPVVISLKEYEYDAETDSWAESKEHYVLAVGLSGNNGIVVDDSAEDTLQTITFGTDAEGNITNEWTYSAYGEMSGNGSFDEAVGKAGVIGYSTENVLSALIESGDYKLAYDESTTAPENEDSTVGCEFSPLDSDVNLLYVSSDGCTVTGGNADEIAAGSGVYRTDGSSSITVSDIKEDSTKIIFASNNSSVSTVVDAGSEAEAEIADDAANLKLSVSSGDETAVELEMQDADGNTVTVTVTGTSANGNVTIIRNGDTVDVEGLDDFKVTVKNGDNTSESRFVVENGNKTSVKLDFENNDIIGEKYTVRWIIDNDEKVDECEAGKEISVPEDPSKTGYSFAGWVPDIPEVMPVKDQEFTATWSADSYDANFDANGGAWIDGAEEKTVSVKFDSKIEFSENPEKQGYVFSGWSVDGVNTVDTLGIMDSVEGKKFIALWISATDTRYTVETYTMDASGEYVLTTQTLSGTTDTTVQINPAIEDGFELNSEKSVLSGTVASDNSLVLKAYIDRKTYMLKTVVDGVSTETAYLYGAKINKPATPSKAGYSFIGWGSSIPETMPAANLTVTAQFKNITTLKIHGNPGSRTINYGDILRLKAITADLPDGAYVKWYVDGSGVSMSQSPKGETCEIKSTGNGTVTVTAKVVDKNGNPVAGADGGEISDSQEVISKAGIWQKIVSFFKNLFGSNRVIAQMIKKVL